jgi:hypothetical protein
MSFFVPYDRSESFFDRGDMLRRIDEVLEKHQKVILTGPGGTG